MRTSTRPSRRLHVHVESGSGEAKFWLEPIVSLAVNKGLNVRELKAIQRIVEKERDAILKEWKKHFRTI
jgi:hypothetical protein